MSNSSSSSNSYAGTFPRSVDAKNRVTVPSRWLEGEEEFHVIPHSSGNCLVILPPAEFDSIAATIRESGRSQEEQRRIIRQIYSKAREVSADGQGRILLPEEQCEALALKGEVVLVGAHSRFEIWSAKRWAAFSAEEEVAANQEAKQFGL